MVLPYGSLHDIDMMLLSGRNCGVACILGVKFNESSGVRTPMGARFSETTQTGTDAKVAGAWR
jgi:hypothetical protein